jgi:hypothetical protein
MVALENEKVCRKCNVSKPLSDFNNLKKSSDGKNTLCRKCAITYQREYYRNPETKAIQKKAQLKYDLKQETKDRKSLYFVSNKTRFKDYQRIYTSRPDVKKRICELQKKYDSLIKRSVRTLTKRQWIRILKLQNYSCYICNTPFTKENPATRDHIIPVSCFGDLTSGNIQALCISCNCKKHAKSPFGNAIDTLLF